MLRRRARHCCGAQQPPTCTTQPGPTLLGRLPSAWEGSPRFLLSRPTAPPGAPAAPARCPVPVQQAQSLSAPASDPGLPAPPPAAPAGLHENGTKPGSASGGEQTPKEDGGLDKTRIRTACTCNGFVQTMPPPGDVRGAPLLFSSASSCQLRRPTLPLSASAGSLLTPPGLMDLAGSLMGAMALSSNTKHRRALVMCRLPGKGICVWEMGRKCRGRKRRQTISQPGGVQATLAAPTPPYGSTRPRRPFAGSSPAGRASPAREKHVLQNQPSGSTSLSAHLLHGCEKVANAGIALQQAAAE